MINTPKNILTNKNVVLTSFNENWQGVRITGVANYYTNGEYYDLCKKYFFKNDEENSSEITKPKGAIVITVEKCEEIE
jgi:hypothetical protein